MSAVISQELFIAPVDDQLLVFDPVTEHAHLLGGIAAWMLTADPSSSVDDLVDQFCADTGQPYDVATAELKAAIATLSDLGLVGRRESFTPPTPLTTTITAPEAAWTVGATHQHLDQSVAFCGPDPALIAAIDTFLGEPPAGSADPTRYFGVIPDGDGDITVINESHITFHTIDQMLWQLPAELNYFVSRTHTMVVLHAGAVRTPDGRNFVVTGPIDAGKSTLTAALIRAGCDYASDESVGTHPVTHHAWAYAKPLTMSVTTQRLVGIDPPGEPMTPNEHRRAGDIRAGARHLAGDIGPIDAIVHVTYNPDAATTIER